MDETEICSKAYITKKIDKVQKLLQIKQMIDIIASLFTCYWLL